MIELAQHIEVLLLENDCVIVPGLGGFVAHYTPAMRVAEENVFLHNNGFEKRTEQYVSGYRAGDFSDKFFLYFAAQ